MVCKCEKRLYVLELLLFACLREVIMSRRKNVKEIIFLASPLLLFAILFFPYSFINGHFIVKWLGCSCPKFDKFGNAVRSHFNANDFTFLFWLFISLCATVSAIFLSKRIPENKRWFRVLYVAAMLLMALFITGKLCRLMMWD